MSPLIGVTGQTLALVSALSDPSVNHDWHVAALQALDQALQESVASYTMVCEQLTALMYLASVNATATRINNNTSASSGNGNGIGIPSTTTLSDFTARQLVEWRVQHEPLVVRLEQDPSLWILLGQTAGLMLKNSLTRPSLSSDERGSASGGMRMQLPYDSNRSNNNNTSCQHIQALLLATTTTESGELRAVASSIIAAVAVSMRTESSASAYPLQPALHVAHGWPTLVPTLHAIMQSNLTGTIDVTAATVHSQSVIPVVEGVLLTLCKIMEDGPSVLSQHDLDQTVALLIHILTQFVQTASPPAVVSNRASISVSMVIMALQSLVHCWAAPVWPRVAWENYWRALSGLATLTASTDMLLTSGDDSSKSSPWVLRHWVCRSMVTLLDSRTSDIAPYLQQLLPFLLSASVPPRKPTDRTTNRPFHDDDQDHLVALEACDFWLTFASLDDNVLSGEMHDAVGAVLPQLIPILLSNMVYSPARQAELHQLNEMAAEEAVAASHHNDTAAAKSCVLRPIFHKSRNAPSMAAASTITNASSSAPVDDDDDDDDDEIEDDSDDADDDDDEGWTLRKCSAASLDALANLYGGDIILPSLLPSLELGLQQTNDPWKQEACILALGAIAEGCWEEMSAHMAQIHPYLMRLLAADQTSTTQGATHAGIIPSNDKLPQLKCMAAWTLGQYAVWAVERVQSGQQGHLLAQMTEELLRNLTQTLYPKIQVACGAALGVIVGAAGDLMAPYLEPVFIALSNTVTRYQGQSLITVLDVYGTIGECCGPVIAEGHLPTLYIPQLILLWDRLAQRDVRDRTLLTLMESLASIALVSAMNFQPYALETFEKSMSMIESVTLLLMSVNGDNITNEEDVDPIIAAIDLIDSLVEGLGLNFATLVQSSARYGPQFMTVVLNGCRHDIPGVRMSSLAQVGDLARNTPALLETSLSLLLPEAIDNMDPVQPSVAINAVWAVGEICLRCQGHPALLEPHAPALLQSAIGLLMGNGTDNNDRGGGSAVLGLAENAAACVGRLALVHPHFVASHVSRFLCGWCDGMGKIRDARERHDAFSGFVAVVYTNPQAVLQAPPTSSNGASEAGGSFVTEAIVSIIFAILTWHIPDELPDDATRLLSEDEYNLVPFPSTEAELGATLVKLVQDIKASVGHDVWQAVILQLPPNVQSLLRDTYKAQ